MYLLKAAAAAEAIHLGNNEYSKRTRFWTIPVILI